MLECLFKKVVGPQSCNFLKKRQMFSKFLGTPFLQNFGWLLLKETIHKFKPTAAPLRKMLKLFVKNALNVNKRAFIVKEMLQIFFKLAF